MSRGHRWAEWDRVVGGGGGGHGSDEGREVPGLAMVMDREGACVGEREGLSRVMVRGGEISKDGWRLVQGGWALGDEGRGRE